MERKWIIKNICTLVLSGIFTAVVIYCADNYNVSPTMPFNLICYICCFIAIPIVCLILCWQRHLFRRYLCVSLLVLIIILPWIYYSRVSVQDSNISSYLSQNSEFMVTACTVMPDSTELSYCEDVVYLHEKGNAGYEIIKMTTTYSPEVYLERSAIIDQKFTEATALQLEDIQHLYFEGHYYVSCLLRHSRDHYAVAYSKCTECCSISWIFFSSEDLAYMSVQDAFEYCMNR